jgi:hypothetical protein
MKAATHTSAPKGKRIRVVLRNGDVFIDKFVDHKSGVVRFKEHSIRTSDLKSFTIVR